MKNKVNIVEYFDGLTESGFDPIDRDQIDSELQEGADNNESISGIIDEIDQATPSLPSFEDTGLGEFATDVESTTSPVMPVFLIIYENSFILKFIQYFISSILEDKHYLLTILLS